MVLRFRVVSSDCSGGTFEGRCENFSDTGIFFTAVRRMGAGDPIQMFFTIPGEVTGTHLKPVPCRGGIIPVRQKTQGNGRHGFAAHSDRWELENPGHR
jgi:hypothetical protein